MTCRHRWLLDASSRGTCTECGAEREFATAQQEAHNSYWDTRRRKGLDASPVNKKGRGK